MAGFDTYACDYDAALNRGIAVSGEDKNYFAKGRILWLARCLKELAFAPKSVLDYGCGTGTATPFLIDELGAKSVIGVDLSVQSLVVAEQAYKGLPVDYKLTSEYTPDETIDLVFCNGVFHHIAPRARLGIVKYIARCLRPGGLFALWENNPWNPGTRYVMSRIPFDRDAVVLSARTARALVEAAHLLPVRTDYCFVFPRVLGAFRWIEEYIVRLPLGAQYLVLCRKSTDGSGAHSTNSPATASSLKPARLFPS